MIDEGGGTSNSVEYRDIIAAIYRIVGASERRFDSLRETDRDAVKLAHDELIRRLEGFPQQFATKVEMEEASRSVQRLEKESVSRELYEQQRDSLSNSVIKNEVAKLDRAVFDTFVENYRIELARSLEDRRNVVTALSTATDAVREQFIEERNQFLTIEAYDQRHQVLVRQVDAVERWQYKLVGGLVFATFVAPLVTGVIVYFITKGI